MKNRKPDERDELIRRLMDEVRALRGEVAHLRQRVDSLAIAAALSAPGPTPPMMPTFAFPKNTPAHWPDVVCFTDVSAAPPGPPRGRYY